MSAELLNAVYASCAASSFFQSALAQDPNLTGASAIFKARTNFDPPVFDCLTYTCSTSMPDRRFDAVIQGGSAAPVESFRVDFAYYTAGDDTAPIEAALGAGGEVDVLFRLAAGFSLTDSSGDAAGNVFRVACLTRQMGLYDEKLHKLFGLASYLFYVQFPAVNG